MKTVKVFLVFLFLVLTVPIAFADINLYHFGNTKYNWGDLVLFNGDVIYSNDTRANLNIILKCGSSSQQIAVELMDLFADEVKEFSRLVTMPNSLSGQCNVELNLVDFSGALFETKVFEGFELTNDLKGNFEISKTTFQLGDVLTVNGLVTRQNNAVVDG